RDLLAGPAQVRRLVDDELVVAHLVDGTPRGGGAGRVNAVYDELVAGHRVFYLTYLVRRVRTLAAPTLFSFCSKRRTASFRWGIASASRPARSKTSARSVSTPARILSHSVHLIRSAAARTIASPASNSPRRARTFPRTARQRNWASKSLGSVAAAASASLLTFSDSA